MAWQMCASLCARAHRGKHVSSCETYGGVCLHVRAMLPGL